MGDNDRTILTKEELRTLMKESVHEMLLHLGLDINDLHKVQRDFIFLREFREAMESVGRKTVLAVVSILVAFLLAALGLGLRASLCNEQPCPQAPAAVQNH